MKEFKELRKIMSKAGLSFTPSVISEYARFAVIENLETANVAYANMVIEAAVESKGINADRLVRWMNRAIPHKLDPETKTFGKRVKNKKAPALAEAFIAKNPDFYKWRPNDESKVDHKAKALREDKRNKHVKALKSSASEILKCDCNSLTSSDIKAIENLISDLNSMINGLRIIRGHTMKAEVKAHFVSGGLPSLGKKRN